MLLKNSIAALLIFITAPCYMLFARDTGKLEKEKASVENKILVLKEFRYSIHSRNNENHISENKLLLDQAARYGKEMALEGLTDMYAAYKGMLDEYYVKRSLADSLEKKLLSLQWNIANNEEQFKSLLKEWRTAWDSYLQSEINTRSQLIKAMADLESVVSSNIDALEEKLIILKQDIRYSSAIKMVDSLDYKNIVETIRMFYFFVAENRDYFNDKNLDEIARTDKKLYRLAYNTILYMEPSALIEFGRNVHPVLIDSTLDNLDIKFPSREKFLELIPYLADSIGKARINKTISLRNCIPVVEGTYNLEDKSASSDYPYFVRKEPVTMEELKLYYLSTGRYDALDNLRHASSAGGWSIPDGFTDWAGYDILNKDDLYYIYMLTVTHATSLSYKNMLSQISLKSWYYFKIDTSQFADKEKSLTVLDKYWDESHPRRIIFKYAGGILFDKFNFETQSNSKNYGIDKWGNITNSILVGYRFGFSGYDGSDDVSSYIALKYENISNGFDPGYIGVHKPDTSINVSGFTFSGNEFHLGYCLDNVLLLTAGYGSGSIKYTERDGGIEKKVEVNPKYYVIAGNVMFPFLTYFSADIFGRYYIFEEPMRAPNASVGISISVQTSAFRF